MITGLFKDVEANAKLEDNKLIISYEKKKEEVNLRDIENLEKYKQEKFFLFRFECKKDKVVRFFVEKEKGEDFEKQLVEKVVGANEEDSSAEIEIEKGEMELTNVKLPKKTINNLPKDVFQHVFKFCQLSVLFESAFEVNKYFNEVVKSFELWEYYKNNQRKYIPFKFRNGFKFNCSLEGDKNEILQNFVTDVVSHQGYYFMYVVSRDMPPKKEEEKEELDIFRGKQGSSFFMESDKKRKKVAEHIPPKYYKRLFWLTVFFCFFFPPVGMYGLVMIWEDSKKKDANVVAFYFAVLISFFLWILLFLPGILFSVIVLLLVLNSTDWDIQINMTYGKKVYLNDMKDE